MNLAELNTLDKPALRQVLSACNASSRWLDLMEAVFPVKNEGQLFEMAHRNWHACREEDWKEAFLHHPKIGDMATLRSKFASTAEWAAGEQAGIQSSSEETLQSLATTNRRYEDKFGFIFIVFATGKTAAEMLDLLHERLENEPEEEIKVAMLEQEKITALRLEKLLQL